MSAAADAPRPDVASPLRALPFCLSLTLLPVLVLAAWLGGWWVLLVPACAWGVTSALDAIGGLETANPDPKAARGALGWYRAITRLWGPVQFATIFGTLSLRRAGRPPVGLVRRGDDVRGGRPVRHHRHHLRA